MMEQIYINGKSITFEEVKNFFKENNNNLALTAREFGLEYHKAHFDRYGQSKRGNEAEMLFGNTWYTCKNMKKIVYGEYKPTRTYNRHGSEGKDVKVAVVVNDFSLKKERIWMWNKNDIWNDGTDVFSTNILKMGSEAKGKLDFASYKSKDEMGEDYRKVQGNTDVSIPDMYWKFMKEVKPNDVVVVFGSTKESGKNICHLLYGWGRFSSDCKYVPTDNNPIQREVQWHVPPLAEPIRETKTSNSRYFHSVEGAEATNIKKLLGIDSEQNQPVMEDLNKQKYISLLQTNHNLILTGAPGTGKTYLAKQLAQLMIFGEIKDIMTDAEEKQFGEQYGFVQFHPSYDYTDFVEGLRPIQDDNRNIGFERRDGVFKKFCAKAVIANSSDASVISKLDSNPTVWKVSLAGTGDNPVRKDCFENGHIRIGWKQYGDIEDFYDYDNFTGGGKNVLRAFQSQMKEGDIVVSCYSAKEIDAIGVITGEYEYRTTGGEFPRYRKVNWFVKNIRENIVEINGNKAFTQSTVYKSAITVENALKIVNKYSSIATTTNKPFVFIIDEINRGEISKIFGELFYSIDPGYRGKEKGKVNTQYQNLVEQGDVFYNGFFVPENVYIIATMNDIDRSVESMDFAFRRRFAFKEIKAVERIEMLDSLPWKEEAVKKMNLLNAEIEKVEGLSRAYHIGPAYFLRLNNYDGDFDQLWECHLEGLLYEYMRGMTEVPAKLKKLAEVYGYSKAGKYVQSSNN